MPADQALLLGLGMVFLAVLVPSAALALTRREHAQVARSLEAINRISFSGSSPVAQEDASFSSRVLKPLLSRCATLARRLTPAGAVSKLGRRLDLAGNPTGLDVERVLALKGAGLLAGLLVAATIVPGGWKVLALPACALFGFYVPDILLTNRGQKRQEELQRGLPDALDLLTISVEAGLGFDAALAQVARKTAGPLSGEFFRVLQEMQIGKTRAAAFRGLAERTTVPELRAFVSSLVQADQFGIPVANVLREQSRELRLKRRQRAEEKAQKIPIKILFPMIFFIFPALFVVIIGPGAITVIRSFSG